MKYSLTFFVALITYGTALGFSNAHTESEWRSVDSFSDFDISSDQWINLGNFGWVYVVGGSNDQLFFWDNATEHWFFTGDSVYPWMYAFGYKSGWLWFFENSRPGLRFFGRGDNGQVVSDHALKSSIELILGPVTVVEPYTELTLTLSGDLSAVVEEEVSVRIGDLELPALDLDRNNGTLTVAIPSLPDGSYEVQVIVNSAYSTTEREIIIRSLIPMSEATEENFVSLANESISGFSLLESLLIADLKLNPEPDTDDILALKNEIDFQINALSEHINYFLPEMDAEMRQIVMLALAKLEPLTSRPSDSSLSLPSKLSYVASSSGNTVTDGYDSKWAAIKLRLESDNEIESINKTLSEMQLALFATSLALPQAAVVSTILGRISAVVNIIDIASRAAIPTQLSNFEVSLKYASDNTLQSTVWDVDKNRYLTNFEYLATQEALREKIEFRGDFVNRDFPVLDAVFDLLGKFAEKKIKRLYKLKNPGRSKAEIDRLIKNGWLPKDFTLEGMGVELVVSLVKDRLKTELKTQLDTSENGRKFLAWLSRAPESFDFKGTPAWEDWKNIKFDPRRLFGLNIRYTEGSERILALSGQGRSASPLIEMGILPFQPGDVQLRFSLGWNVAPIDETSTILTGLLNITVLNLEPESMVGSEDITPETSGSFHFTINGNLPSDPQVIDPEGREIQSYQFILSNDLDFSGQYTFSNGVFRYDLNPSLLGDRLWTGPKVIELPAAADPIVKLDIAERLDLNGFSGGYFIGITATDEDGGTNLVGDLTYVDYSTLLSELTYVYNGPEGALSNSTGIFDVVVVGEDEAGVSDPTFSVELPNGEILVEGDVKFDPNLTGLPMYSVGISSSGSRSYFLSANGTVWWTGTWYTQFGTGARDPIFAPRAIRLEGISEVTDISSASISHRGALFLRKDGSVWAVGSNYGNVFGDLRGDEYEPFQLPELSGITAISYSGDHSLFLKNDGTVWAMGINNSGQLGLGTLWGSRSPTKVSGLNGIISIAAGSNHSLFLKNDGTVWATGNNGLGQLGDGTNTNRLAPIQVTGLSNITAISSYLNSSYFLKSDGTVWAVGRNDYGQLGDGTKTDRNIPVQVSGLSEITAIDAGMFHCLFIKKDGTAWAVGTSWYGQLGDGTFTESRTIPVQVSRIRDVIAISAGDDSSLFIDSENRVWGVGGNYYGQLGDGTDRDRTIPVRVTRSK